MQKRVALSLILALALGACRSSEPEPAPAPDVDLSAVPCTCGDAMTAVVGCAHPLCASGETNPGNPDCVCGTIGMDEEIQ